MKNNIRQAVVSDSDEILKIYTPYVNETAITFETEVPSIKEFSERIESISENYPYLVYEEKNKIIGYAYASKHRERAAYLYDVDVSIYVLPKYHNSGIARELYDCLFTILKELGYRNAYAAYTVPNNKSKRFHEKFDFKHVGIFHNTGYKFNKWHDVAWMEKNLNEYNENPSKIKNIQEWFCE